MFWKARGHTTEAVEALRALLDVPTAQEPVLLRSRALATAAYLLEQTGGYETAEEYCAEALAIARSAGDDCLVADLLDVRAFILPAVGSGPGRWWLIDQGLGLRTLTEELSHARLLARPGIRPGRRGRPCLTARDAAESVLLYRRSVTGYARDDSGAARIRRRA